MKADRSFVSSGLLLGFLLLSGCGGSNVPEIGYVEGKVTLDGKPLPNALLTFQPEHARPSYARTDESGHYELVYTDGNYGAIPGPHTVMITTATSGDPDQDIPASKEILPAKYNRMTELTATVEKGENTIDFKLDSKGEIVEEAAGG